VIELPFDVKPAKDNGGTDLLNDPLIGYPAIHPNAAELLFWLAEHAKYNGWGKPIVTEFGRTRQMQVERYLPGLMQTLEQKGISNDRIAKEHAHERAWNRFSWHCISKEDGRFRAFDLRARTYTPQQIDVMLTAARRHFGARRIETLHHSVPGGHVHLHLAFKANELPKDWL
jgi:hypothetical protein